MQQAGAEDEIEGDVITDETTALFNELDKQLAAAAEEGLGKLQEVWGGFLPREQRLMEAAKNERHKPRALKVSSTSSADMSQSAVEEEGGAQDQSADQTLTAAHVSSSAPPNADPAAATRFRKGG
jgi:hypothetical protein